jgi:hypothetical protein
MAHAAVLRDRPGSNIYVDGSNWPLASVTNAKIMIQIGKWQCNNIHPVFEHLYSLKKSLASNFFGLFLINYRLIILPPPVSV